VVGILFCRTIPSEILKFFVCDAAATVAVFIFSVLFRNSSVYDAYWSFTPMVMSVWLFCAERAFSFWQILFLIAFNIWSLRLTCNWITVFTDFSYEDWRYTKLRAENPMFLWWIINFFGIHMVPTIVVFLGMLPLFPIARSPVNGWILPGILVLLSGVALEFFADRQMHAFLRTVKEKVSCRVGLWKYSRHPNYLGEILTWCGVYVSMLPFHPELWFYGIGALSVSLLFNFVSIPMMEKRQSTRRADYAEYQKTTSRLLLLPNRH
ncbi:MAG: DUF1295 domain-containing protein, partial [Clostridia bacterium]|nr:DUF1295 domain-containing protein [Clostridia bacterium]